MRTELRSEEAEFNIVVIACNLGLLYSYPVRTAMAGFPAGMIITPRKNNFSGSLVDFFKSPVKWYFNYILDIAYNEPEDILDETEIFELNNLQKKRLQVYLVNKQKVQNLATDKFFESVFGSSHPYGKQVLPADFENITRDKLLNFHTDHYARGKLAIIISGHIHNDTKTVLEHYFGEHDFNQNITYNKNIQINGNENKSEFIEKKNALQSAIRIGSATINKRHKDYPGLLILDTILGGYFGSRLMKNIREEKGYTYGINSTFASLNQSGYKVIATEVGKKFTGKTIAEIYKEIRLLQTRLVETKELDVVRSYMAGEMLRMFDGPFALAESFRAVWEFGLDNSYYYNLAEKIITIEPDEIIALANTYYNIDDLYEIIAGSK